MNIALIILGSAMVAWSVHVTVRRWYPTPSFKGWITTDGIDNRMQPGVALSINGAEVPDGIYRLLDVVIEGNAEGVQQRLHIMRVL